MFLRRNFPEEKIILFGTSVLIIGYQADLFLPGPTTVPTERNSSYPPKFRAIASPDVRSRHTAVLAWRQTRAVIQFSASHVHSASRHFWRLRFVVAVSSRWPRKFMCRCEQLRELHQCSHVCSATAHDLPRGCCMRPDTHVCVCTFRLRTFRLQHAQQRGLRFVISPG